MIRQQRCSVSKGRRGKYRSWNHIDGKDNKIIRIDREGTLFLNTFHYGIVCVVYILSLPVSSSHNHLGQMWVGMIFRIVFLADIVSQKNQWLSDNECIHDISTHDSTINFLIWLMWTMTLMPYIFYNNPFMFISYIFLITNTFVFLKARQTILFQFFTTIIWILKSCRAKKNMVYNYIWGWEY